jgi:hypothetical protein
MSNIDHAFSGDSASYCDEHRSGNAKCYGGNQGRKQPLVIGSKEAGDYGQASYCTDNMDKGHGHVPSLAHTFTYAH